MTRIAPNPYSPYADADPTTRHIFEAFAFLGNPHPGGLVPAACGRLAVVPEETLRDATGGDGTLLEGLCPVCLAAMNGEELPEDTRPVGQCRECESATDHDGLCALCRQDKHEEWWPTRNADTKEPAQ
ncbi:MAG: hypothetical protein HOY75_08135 [Streptomyces sp.]|nr:hypothetical protein [Streptomyces sp.]